MQSFYQELAVAADLKQAHQPPKALSGLRVLDIATFLAAPFCGTIMADFGADVIKIEQPKGGDSLRKFGTPSPCGDTYMWMSEARNKRFVTLDLRTPEGAALFKELVRESDVVLENFRPGTLEKWGLGYDVLSELNPGLILLRVSAYGQDGPKREEPGFARIAHAFGGLAHLAGEPDGPPVVPGSTSLADYISGLWGAIGVLTALQARNHTGRGQVVDIGLYESVFRLLDELAPVYAATGFVRRRLGADVPNVAPHSHYQTRCGQWVAIACSNDRMFERLASAMGAPGLAGDARFASAAARAENRQAINALVAAWSARFDLQALLDLCRNEGVPCSKVYSIEDIFQDEQYRARGNLMEVDDPRIGKTVLPASVPRLSGTPARFLRAGGALGQDNAGVYEELLGVCGERLAALRQAGVV
ncbi:MULTISPECIES: CaiB/BaiF CoA transferase family protein [Bordetella]|uniref:CoA transferase n=1 Tax=Bordetella genomosp. 6 TaxID=463024 RepID=A0ABX4F782_9BORD|nr:MULTISPECIES: CoA transferase [Bordetella]AOB25166.1 carnitine dehydratase [Bordetella bronchiseptica]AZW42409.1 CoA transferase [Bordetella bronchiseptica]KCV64487.1 CoA-transferase family III protein [Bordetella bronchiseptica 99-R-0433]MBN3267751.1 CoA transferase [Bordetella bronchiseptica]OZI70137.1 CoA transferase [Bordetella genomosp. 6]